MAHSYKSESYHNPEDSMGKVRYRIFHNNSSHPDSPVTIVPDSINGEKIVFEDPRRVEIVLPFGLLAEFVGFRVVRDRRNTAEVDEARPRHILGLANQGADPTHD